MDVRVLKIGIDVPVLNIGEYITDIKNEMCIPYRLAIYCDITFEIKCFNVFVVVFSNEILVACGLHFRMIVHCVGIL